MTFGRPIFQAVPLEAARIATIGPRQAMAAVLREYLLCARFSLWSGGLDADREFGLREVFAEWPDAGRDLPYPCASIVEQADTFYEGHNFTPTPLEETLGVYDCPPGRYPPSTVLWKVAEATVSFQIDFWASNLPDRESLEAELGHLFNPGQERSGVLLGGHPRFYDRPVRATLLSHRRIDLEDSVYPNERRLQTIVRCEVDVVHLRRAVLLSPIFQTAVTDEPGDINAPPPTIPTAPEVSASARTPSASRLLESEP